jgi:predicted DNA-binding transcriptional regulator AlpA
MPEKPPKLLRRSKRAEAFERKYISAAELAVRWDVSASAIYQRKCGSNALSAIRFGRSIRFLRSEVEALEERREEQTRRA